jgi:hypothetical protein
MIAQQINEDTVHKRFTESLINISGLLDEQVLQTIKVQLIALELI